MRRRNASDLRKPDHDRSLPEVRLVALSKLKPAQINGQVYKTPDESRITSMAEAFHRALTSKQVTDLRLPPKLTAKSTSSRRNAFVAQHGENVFELEAVEPRRLQQLVRNGIESVLDIELFNHEQKNERRDARELAAARRQVQTALAGVQFTNSSRDDDEHDD
jgi:hypothetical protein